METDRHPPRRLTPGPSLAPISTLRYSRFEEQECKPLIGTRPSYVTTDPTVIRNIPMATDRAYGPGDAQI